MSSQDEFDTMKYFMAAEKVGNLIFQLEMMMQFVEEYKIVADENVKSALIPHVEKLRQWLK